MERRRRRSTGSREEQARERRQGVEGKTVEKGRVRVVVEVWWREMEEQAAASRRKSTATEAEACRYRSRASMLSW